MAERLLLSLGYRVVARNWRGGGGEIDRVAWDGAVLAFVEIRARRTGFFGSPAGTVDVAKQRRVVCAAAAYLSRFRGRCPDVRFDVVSIVDGTGERSAELIRSAFESHF